MKIFIHAHYYLPKTLAGAEKFLHAIAKHFLVNGHEAIVSVDDDVNYEYEEIQVVSNKGNIQQWYAWADAVLTHLLNAETAIFLAAQFKKPLYHLLHNNEPSRLLQNGLKNNFIIYNSEALKNELRLNYPSIVAHPYVDVNHWQNTKDHYYNIYITLVNCCIEKGGAMLLALADMMPHQKFMGVKGGYGVPLIQLNAHRNLQFMPPQTDMRNIYDQTRIIIMPSNYESWGMVASEAMASGIPVICTDTPGLRENCGEAAIYIPYNSPALLYRDAISELDNKTLYDHYVKLGKERNKTSDLDKILEFMTEEKVDYSDFKEKKEIKPAKEKKQITKPGTKKKKQTHDKANIMD